MQNNFIIKINCVFFNKLNTDNLIVLPIFLIYFFSITLAPIIKSIISVRNNKFITAQNKNVALRAQILKAKANNIYTINTVTYINNGQILSRQIDNNNLQSYINDAKGSVLKLNNSDGTSAQNYSYDAYGNIISNPTLPSQRTTEPQQSNLNERSSRSLHKFAMIVENSFQYNGERSDNNTKLQYLRARFYNPETKRFINQDSYDLLNRFGYVDGNSIMGADPSGHDSIGLGDVERTILTILGFGIGGGLSVAAGTFVTHKYAIWRGAKEKHELSLSAFFVCSKDPGSRLTALDREIQNTDNSAERKGAELLRRCVDAIKVLPSDKVMPVFAQLFSKGDSCPVETEQAVICTVPKSGWFCFGRDYGKKYLVKIDCSLLNENNINDYCTKKSVADSIKNYMQKFRKYFSEHDTKGKTNKLFPFNIKESYAKAYITGNSTSVLMHLIEFMHYLEVTEKVNISSPYQTQEICLAVCHFNGEMTFKAQDISYNNRRFSI